ncbi:MAG: tryptophan synthase subunit alpha [Chloroflexi bacterium]|nr:tryptophan synthase subunit alpha [Chloroflexota bacterium]
MSRFSSTFERLQRDDSTGLLPYLMAGYPDVQTSRALADVALATGADGFEIGVPFSDPLADGATLQRVNVRALERGATLQTALDLARHIRQSGPECPIALMTYYNPVRQSGESRFADEVRAAGADGVIVPDLPPEEAGPLADELRRRELSFIPLLAPTSPPARIEAVAALEPAFIYCVALVGLTGARSEVSATLGDFLGRVRAITTTPLVVGFGVSQPQHVRRIAELGAEGVIVASALLDLVDRSAEPVEAARAYLTELKSATHRADVLVS